MGCAISQNCTSVSRLNVSPSMKNNDSAAQCEFQFLAGNSKLDNEGVFSFVRQRPTAAATFISRHVTPPPNGNSCGCLGSQTWFSFFNGRYASSAALPITAPFFFASEARGLCLLGAYPACILNRFLGKSLISWWAHKVSHFLNESIA